MNCIIDRGNTKTKIYFFDSKTLNHAAHFNNDENELIEDCLEQNQFDYGIISSSADTPAYFEKYNFLRFSHQSKLPIKLNYRTPHTLGTDRIALAVGALETYPESNSLIISLGTCITMDILNNKAVYEGGIIAPGIHMRRKAMHTQTANLPLIDMKALENPPLIGKSTEESMASGIIHATQAEINGLIQRFESIYNDLTVILTGGDMDLFEFHAKNKIFAQPNLQAIGLNRILIDHVS